MTLHLGSVTARQVVRRALFRGARIERRSTHHLVLRHGDRRTTVPLFAGWMPHATVERIQRDLGIDLARPPTASQRNIARR